MTYHKVLKRHKKVSSLLNVYRNFVVGTYTRLSHTVLSCIVPCVHTSEQDV